MLLQRGHGSILSGFFRVFSCEILVSLCSSSVLQTFGVAVSLSTEGVLGFSLIPEDVAGSVNCSEIGGGAPSSSSSVSVGFPCKGPLNDLEICVKTHPVTEQNNTLF